jgi:hypothetical protein
MKQKYNNIDFLVLEHKHKQQIRYFLTFTVTVTVFAGAMCKLFTKQSASCGTQFCDIGRLQILEQYALFGSSVTIVMFPVKD